MKKILSCFFVLFLIPIVASAQITLDVSDATNAAGSTDNQITVSMDNPNDPVYGIQFDICEEGDDLTCTECQLSPGISGFNCSFNEIDNGCCRIILFDVGGDAEFDYGSNDLVNILYDVSPSATPGNCLTLDPEGIAISSTDKEPYAGAINTEPGSFCITGTEQNPPRVIALYRGLVPFSNDTDYSSPCDETDDQISMMITDNDSIDFDNSWFEFESSGGQTIAVDYTHLEVNSSSGVAHYVFFEPCITATLATGSYDIFAHIEDNAGNSYDQYIPNSTFNVDNGSTYSLSGTITFNGEPFANAYVVLNEDTSTATKTDSNGKYVFSGLSNGDYSLTPWIYTVSFDPGSRGVTINGSNVSGLDFEGFVIRKITGKIKLSNGVGIPGAHVWCGGTKGGYTRTDKNGNYALTNLPTGNYTVGCLIEFHTKTPKTISVNIIGKDVIGQDFIATPVNTTYKISGKILKSTGFVLPDVTVWIQGPKNSSTKTDSAGNFSFSGLANGTYKITPYLKGYTMSPGDKDVTIKDGDKTNQNFYAYADKDTYNMWGFVFNTDGMTKMIGLGVSLYKQPGWVYQKQVLTQANGGFEFDNCEDGETYSVCPNSYTFEPYCYTKKINGADQGWLLFKRVSK